MGSNHPSHEEIVKRLKRASGHLTKVITMIEGGQPCTKVAQQLHAVTKAIGNAKQAFVQDHIEHCLDGEQTESASVREVISELKEISKYL